MLVSGTVRNDPWYRLTVLPDTSAAVSSRNTCTRASGDHGCSGVNSTTRPPPETTVVPLTSSPFCATYSAPGTVAALSASVRYSTMLLPNATPDAPLPGRWLTTHGCCRSGCAPVLNWLVKSARAFPDRSSIPLVSTSVTTSSQGSVPPPRVSVRLS